SPDFTRMVHLVNPLAAPAAVLRRCSRIDGRGSRLTGGRHGPVRPARRPCSRASGLHTYPLENITVKSAVETLDATKVKLTVEVPYDELKPSIDHAYQHIAEQVSVPGFRKGKVPPRIIEQRVGRAAVLEHAVNEGLPGFYRQAVAETDIRPLGQP